MTYKKIMKDSLTLGKIGLTNSIMASAVGSVGGNTAGLTAFSQFTPVMGSVMGAGHTIRMVRTLKPKVGRRRRK